MSMLLPVPTVLMISLLSAAGTSSKGQDAMPKQSPPIQLPAPTLDGSTSLESAILRRRSERDYASASLTLSHISQLCWAAQGTTREDGRRTAPSAGALYPLELILIADNVLGLGPGLYRYRSSDHTLTLIRSGRFRVDVAQAALGQESVRDAPATLAISAVISRTTGKYGDRGIRYIHMEAGHAAQNLALQAVALGLGCVTVGAFQDAELSRILGFSKDEEPLYLLPVGYPSVER
jgi:SagB-type dehydrogenase family enzyme